MPYLYSSPWTGIHIVDGDATWISSTVTVSEHLAQGIKSFGTERTEDDARRFIDGRDPMAGERNALLAASMNTVMHELLVLEQAQLAALLALDPTDLQAMADEHLAGVQTEIKALQKAKATPAMAGALRQLAKSEPEG